MRAGLDTSFFVELLKKNEKCLELWRNVIDGNSEAVASAMTLLEIQRLGFKGVIPRQGVGPVMEALKLTCELVFPDHAKFYAQAAQISHGEGMPAVDALILSTFLDQKCDHIYTTDSHFLNYKRKGLKIINLRE